jgi:hypothetical protein
MLLRSTGSGCSVCDRTQRGNRYATHRKTFPPVHVRRDRTGRQQRDEPDARIFDRASRLVDHPVVEQLLCWWVGARVIPTVGGTQRAFVVARTCRAWVGSVPTSVTGRFVFDSESRSPRSQSDWPGPEAARKRELEASGAAAGSESASSNPASSNASRRVASRFLQGRPPGQVRLSLGRPRSRPR